MQYWRFLGRLVHGDLGSSLFYGVPAGRLVIERLPVTLWLIGLGTLLSVLIAVPLATLAAAERDRPTDHVVRAVPLVGLGFPPFWIGIMLLLAFALNLGRRSRSAATGRAFFGHLHSMFLPALTVALAISPILIRSLRASLLEVLESDYVATARSKGLPERRVLVRHGLRNAVISMVTVLGVNIGFLVGGTLVVEQVFALPGARPADDQLDLPARLPGRAGGHARLRDHGRARVPDHGHRPRAPRPAGALRLMALAAASTPRHRSSRSTAASVNAGTGRRRSSPGSSILGAIVARWRSSRPLVTWHDPIEQDLVNILQGPSWSHPLGTDDLGRDVWTRLVYGARTDLRDRVPRRALPVRARHHRPA